MLAGRARGHVGGHECAALDVLGRVRQHPEAEAGGGDPGQLEDAEASEASQENDRNTLALTDSVAPRPGLETPAPPPRSRSTHTIGRGGAGASDQSSR